MSLNGLEGRIVELESVIHRGLPAFTIVGLPDASIQEARERVRAAIKQSGFEFPKGKIALNLAPADLKKQGPRFDLAIALAILESHRQITFPKRFERALFLGELGFTGDLRPIVGVLPSVHAAQKYGYEIVVVPQANAEEAALVKGINVLGVESLRAIADIFQSVDELVFQVPTELNLAVERPVSSFDFQFIKGNAVAKRGLEIAAAGGHNVLLSGPPGSGKTLLARAFSTILPTLTFTESLDITKVHSVAGTLDNTKPMLADRPFRAVHHTASGVAIVGGGNPPRPGEISLAHRGVLFLDEFAEFSAKTLEVLRQPLEDGEIRISRAAGTVTYPAQFSLVAAMNPCPCGYYKDPKKECTCAPFAVQRYRQKISGPILDRIDMHLQVPRIEVQALTQTQASEPSNVVRARVQKARAIQQQRFKNKTQVCNADLSSAAVQKCCRLNKAAQTMMEQVIEKMQLSGRGYFRTLKLARTIADLEAQDLITEIHLAEAVQYREPVI